MERRLYCDLGDACTGTHLSKSLLQDPTIENSNTHTFMCRPSRVLVQQIEVHACTLCSVLYGCAHVAAIITIVNCSTESDTGRSAALTGLWSTYRFVVLPTHRPRWRHRLRQIRSLRCFCRSTRNSTCSCLPTALLHTNLQKCSVQKHVSGWSRIPQR